MNHEQKEESALWSGWHVCRLPLQEIAPSPQKTAGGPPQKNAPNPRKKMRVDYYKIDYYKINQYARAHARINPRRMFLQSMQRGDQHS